METNQQFDHLDEESVVALIDNALDNELPELLSTVVTLKAADPHGDTYIDVNQAIFELGCVKHLLVAIRKRVKGEPLWPAR